jgi:hypothetical protein
MRAATRLRERVPDEILIPAANEIIRRKGGGIDALTETEQEDLKKACGPRYGHMSKNEIHRQAINLRKQSKLTPVKGHGPGKREPLLPELQTYYRTSEWQAYRERIGNIWKWRCAMCYGKGTEVHHRTYKRLKAELLTDCILVCHNCHKAADVRRRREYAHNGREQQQELFP